MNHREIKTRDLLLFCVLLENTGHSSGVKSFILGHYLTYIVPPSQVLIIMCIGRFRVPTFVGEVGLRGAKVNLCAVWRECSEPIIRCRSCGVLCVLRKQVGWNKFVVCVIV